MEWKNLTIVCEGIWGLGLRTLCLSDLLGTGDMGVLMLCHADNWEYLIGGVRMILGRTITMRSIWNWAKIRRGK